MSCERCKQLESEIESLRRDVRVAEGALEAMLRAAGFVEWLHGRELTDKELWRMDLLEHGINPDSGDPEVN